MTAPYATVPREHNQSIGEQCHAALIAAAEAKSEALKLERLAKRVFSQLVVSMTGPISQREHAARADIKYISAEDAYITAQTAENIARAHADSAQIRYEIWRTNAATSRAEMNLR